MSSPVDSVICKLCRRQFSKYTCPTCNVPYCSLTCFRSQAHSQCSETFYKKEVELDIHSDSRPPEVRRKMLELLKKFEKDSSEMENLEEESDDDDDDLARRFQDVDLDSTSTDELWLKLTPSEQRKFMKTLEDPTSGLAQQLLASEELKDDRREPWWEAPIKVDGDADAKSNLRRKYDPKPDALTVPSSLAKSWPKGATLIYNLCTICIAYSYATRHFAISPLAGVDREAADIQDAQKLISHLVPFLVDRKSTTLYPNLSSLIHELWSRFKPGQMNSKLFSLLLHDTISLIRPSSITTVPSHATQSTGIDPNSHPHLNLILVLSDLSRLFDSVSCEPSRAVPNYVTHKLVFYAAYVLTTPSPIFCDLVDEISQRKLQYGEISDRVPVIPTIKKEGRAIIEEM